MIRDAILTELRDLEHLIRGVSDKLPLHQTLKDRRADLMRRLNELDGNGEKAKQGKPGDGRKSKAARDKRQWERKKAERQRHRAKVAAARGL